MCRVSYPVVKQWAISLNRRTPPRKSVNRVPRGCSQVMKSQGVNNCVQRVKIHILIVSSGVE